MSFWVHYAVALATVAAILAALGGAGRLVQRARAPSGVRRIDVLESVALAPQSALHLVRVDSQEMLVGTGRVAIVSRLSDRSR